jgi:hypothetical protein
LGRGITSVLVGGMIEHAGFRNHRSLMDVYPLILGLTGWAFTRWLT